MNEKFRCQSCRLGLVAKAFGRVIAFLADQAPLGKYLRCSFDDATEVLSDEL
jgi:hypothetical protein